MKVNPPKGYVSLGLGESFKTKGKFTARARFTHESSWCPSCLVDGDAEFIEYAVPENGWMAKLNGLCPNESQKPSKRVAKKVVSPSSKKKSDAASGPLDPKGIPQHAIDKQKVKEDILEEALRITSGDRQAQYGPPDQDFTRTASMWSALFADKLREPFEARDVAMAMILLKLSRERHQRKRDSAVDIAGYARCLHICNEADELRQQNK